MVPRLQAALRLQRQGRDYNVLFHRCECGRQGPEGLGSPGKEALRKALRRQGIHLAQALRHALRGRHTPGYRHQKQHEEQAYAHVGQNHAAEKVHHRDH